MQYVKIAACIITYLLRVVYQISTELIAVRGLLSTLSKNMAGTQ